MTNQLEGGSTSGLTLLWVFCAQVGEPGSDGESPFGAWLIQLASQIIASRQTRAHMLAVVSTSCATIVPTIPNLKTPISRFNKKIEKQAKTSFKQGAVRVPWTWFLSGDQIWGFFCTAEGQPTMWSGGTRTTTTQQALTIYVTNIPENVTVEDVSSLFSKEPTLCNTGQTGVQHVWYGM